MQQVPARPLYVSRCSFGLDGNLQLLHPISGNIGQELAFHSTSKLVIQADVVVKVTSAVSSIRNRVLRLRLPKNTQCSIQRLPPTPNQVQIFTSQRSAD